jgi:hypothetical protein
MAPSATPATAQKRATLYARGIKRDYFQGKITKIKSAIFDRLTAAQ